jgi:hypothetical protein
MISGLGVRHGQPCAVDHPLDDTYCPDLHLTYANGRRGRLSDLTRIGGLVQIGPPEIVSTGRADLAAALIRPDGVIAWAAPGDSPETLASARGAWE